MEIYGAAAIANPATTSDDQYLVALAVGSQDTEAFGELVRRHQSQVRNFLRKLTGGSLAPLITHLLAERKLSRAEIDRLRAILDEKAGDREEER